MFKKALFNSCICRGTMRNYGRANSLSLSVVTDNVVSEIFDKSQLQEGWALALAPFVWQSLSHLITCFNGLHAARHLGLFKLSQLGVTTVAHD